MNRIFIVGNVGKEPETKEAQSGPVTRFSVATSKKYKDKTQTTWHTVVTFGKLAEVCAKYVSKGMKVLVEGEMQYSEYQKQDGSKGFSANIIAQSVQFLSEIKKQEEPMFNSADEIPF